MPEYLSPGVYVEEVSGGVKPIEGVSTSTAGFVGATERGPESPRLITSWPEFLRWYGGYVDVSYLAYAVQGFFDNGGKRCFIARINGDGAIANTGSVENSKLTLEARGKGTWGNNIRVKLDPATRGPEGAGWFRISLLYLREAPADDDDFVDPFSTDPEDLANPERREPDVFEVFDNLTAKAGAGNNVVNVLNASSRLVEAGWAEEGEDPKQDPQPPEEPKFEVLGEKVGNNGEALTPDNFKGNPTNPMTGLAALEVIDPISLLVVPDEVRFKIDEAYPITTDVVNQCARLKDRFAILSVPLGQGDVSALPFRPDSSYAGYYYPWIKVYDPSINGSRVIPPTGHVAGIFARTDIERGVHKAPANAVVRGAADTEFPVSKGMQDILNPQGVNCIRDFRPDGRGIRLWGARTLSSDPEWKYVNVRRLFLFVEESIDEGTQWVVFEPNDDGTWAKVRRSIGNFLISVWRSGALLGTTQEEAFFVKCDRTTMTQDDIDNGRLICLIGIAPVKPAEFVIFRISQKTAEAA